MKTFIVFLLFGIVSLRSTLAQQDPLYAQYMNNPFVLNPAYAGHTNLLNVSLQYRTQWAQFEGNPVTVAFTGHMPVVEKRMALGMLVIQDQIGETKNTEISGAYSYKLPLGNSTLAFGLQAGIMQYANNPDDLVIRDADDPAFYPYSEMQFNTGAGVLLSGDRFLLGLSVPRLLPATVSQGGESIQVYNRNFYLMAGYLIMLSDNIRFRPSTLLRYSNGNPLSVDINASLTYLDTYTAGLFTRNFNTYGLLLNLRVKKFYFGYVFELPTIIRSEHASPPMK
ncbi:type IX secretion system membrane protein PorP/SprF [Oscillatoria amoena NRMC-F 0135]|nr:type IX secretion system membrane protein PorP/SprF [Oscillatoria amoena NRMC-F 0135]